MSKPLGTAAWADERAVAGRHEYRDGAFWVGRTPSQETPVGFADDRHIFLGSGSRAGKGASIIINNLALWPGSLVVIDPKGENATVTAARRGPGSKHCKGLGQAVHVLDPFNAANVPDALRGRFNPLDALDPEREETIDEAGRIADALVVINPESKDPFFEESARAMVKCLVLHVLTAEEYEGRRNLLTIRDLIMRGDAEKHAWLVSQDYDDPPTAHALLWEGVRSNPHCAGAIARIGSSFHHMYTTSPKQYESVRQVVDRNTEFVDSPGMQRCLEASDFKLSDLKTKREGVSIYLTLPQRYMNTHFRWLRMMISLTLTEMELVRGMPASGHRVLFCLDEFAGLKRMEVIENAVAQVAGFGVKLMFVLQSLEQLKGTYKDKWETFLANCGVKLFFGLEDYFSREYVSKFIGEMEVLREARTTSEASGTQDGTSDSRASGTSTTRGNAVTFGNNTTYTAGKSDGSSTSVQNSQGSSKGSNWNLGLGHNSSDGASWKSQFLFGRDDERQSDNSGWSQNAGYGRNKGTNESRSLTQGENVGNSESLARGINESLSQNSSVSANETKTRQTSHSKTQTSTKGVNEGVHKRRLITEDEIGIFFGRIDDKGHPAYPGFALVLAAGEKPCVVRRVNYYEDSAFINRYDPHPDHAFNPLVEHKYAISAPSSFLLSSLNRHASTSFTASRFLVGEGDRVEAGQPLLNVKGKALGQREASIRIPVSGRISALSGQGSDALQASSGPIAIVTYYGAAQSELNPYEELERLVPAIDAAREHQLLSEKPVIAQDPGPPPAPPKKLPWLRVALAGAALVAVFAYFRSAPDTRRQNGDPDEPTTATKKPASKINYGDWSSLRSETPRSVAEIKDWKEHRRAAKGLISSSSCMTVDGFSAYNGTPKGGILNTNLGRYRFFEPSVLAVWSEPYKCFVEAGRWRYSEQFKVLQSLFTTGADWETLWPETPAPATTEPIDWSEHDTPGSGIEMVLTDCKVADNDSHFKTKTHDLRLSRDREHLIAQAKESGRCFQLPKWRYAASQNRLQFYDYQSLSWKESPLQQ